MKQSTIPRAQGLRDFLAAACQENPTAAALLAPGHQSLKYGQLLEQVDYVGQTLRSLGIPRSQRVAVVLPDGPAMAAACCGVASYAACAPLNPQYRSNDFKFYLTDLRARAVIVPADADSPVRDVAGQLGLSVLELVPAADRPAGGFRFQHYSDTSAVPCDSGRRDNVALVLHTSGTTSRPKQVPLTHENLGCSAGNIAEVLRLSSDDCCLNIMPLFHIHGLVGVLCSSICAGGSVVCCPGFRDSDFAQWMRDFEPTWYSAVPTIHQRVLALAQQNPELAAASRLRLIRSSSAALPPSVMQDLEATFGVPVIESYGMTEAAHQMASNPLPPLERKPGSVGVAAGPEMEIMAEDSRSLPAGQTGEIVIRGPSVMRAYANNPEANARAFSDGWFRTGDLGYRDDEGYFFISGRRTEMINRGGEKITPREIDEALLAHPAVAEAVAFAIPHQSLGEDVAAAVVLRDGADENEQRLREFAFSRLADFKVPSQIVLVTTIPKGPTGKLQRTGLYDKLKVFLQPEYAPPRTQLEANVAAVFAEVLKVERVGVTDNFFALGGDSLTGTRVASRISSDFQIDLPVVSIFFQPTPELMALEITRILGESTGILEDILDELENLPDAEAD